MEELSALEDLKTVTMPDELKGVSAKVVTEDTACSVTCGLGFKTQKLCLVGPLGPKDCETVRVDCMAGWICGMHTYTVTVGQPFTVDCLSTAVGIGSGGLLYHWKISRGIVTTDDMLFRPLRAKTFTITFSAIEEKDAGTYRCDVQKLEDLRLIKRLYYGIKVVVPSLVNLNYDKFLTSKQRIEALAHEGAVANFTEEEPVASGDQMLVVVGVGSCAGILAGIGVGMLLLQLFKKQEVVVQEVEDEKKP
ncbi:hypothetical protein FKM82_018524 [Ascaphus truei]